MHTINFLLKVLSLPAYLHEGLHYLAARAVGLKAELRKDHVLVYFGDTGPVPVLISLSAPALFGLGGIFLGSYDLITGASGWRLFTRFLNLAIALAWTGACIHDIREILSYLRTGSWKNVFFEEE